MRIILTILATCLSVGAATYTLPTDRDYSWKGRVGIRGGLVQHQTMWTNVVTAGAANDGTGNQTTIIQSCLNDCPKGQYVYMPSGTYAISNLISIPNGVELRGAGMSNTFIKSWVADTSTRVISGTFSSTDTTDTNISVHIEKGSTNLWIEDSSGLTVGKMAAVVNLFDHVPLVNNITSSGTVWGPTNSSDMRHEFMVLSISGNDVTIDPPSPWTFSTNTIFVPHIRYEPNYAGTNYGISDLTITNATASPPAWTIYFSNGYENWIKNVRIQRVDSSAIFLFQCVRTEVRGCYLDGYVSAGGQNDGVNLQDYCSGVLVEDNISVGLFPAVKVSENGGSGGNAIAYNYFVNPTTSDPAWVGSSIGSHGGHSMMNLIEGNVVEGFIQWDGFHGSAAHWVVHRNWILGETIDPLKVERIMAIAMERYSYTNSLTGNILGVPGRTYDAYTATNEYSYTYKIIARFGYPAMGGQGYTGNRPPDALSNVDALDFNVTNSVLMHANYNFHDDAWVNLAGQETNLVDSYLYDSKPSYFGGVTWPPIGNNGGLTMTNAIPAMYRYNGEELPSGVGIRKQLRGRATIRGRTNL